MPLYEYQCEHCNEKFEVMQKFADEPLTAHERCGGGPVRRLISVPSFSFKGSGWYVNDYGKGKSPGKDPSSSSSPSDSPAKSSETTKESKPSSDSTSKSSPSPSSSDTK